MMRPIFLVGVPRSGTTMLRLILDSHPVVFSTVELPWIGGNYVSGRFHGPEVSVRCLYRRLLETAPDISGIDGAGLRRACRSFVEEVVRVAMAGRDKAVWVEKTPDNIIQIPFLMDLFPEAKFIRVIRDGRDVALSTVDVQWRMLNYFVDRDPNHLRWINLRMGLRRRLCGWLSIALQEKFLRAPGHALDLTGPTIFYPVANTFHNALYRWQEWNQLYERDAARLGIDQLTVRYEDLTRDPHGVFPGIFKFIDVEWDERVLNYLGFDHDLRQGDVGWDSAMKFTGVSGTNARKWKRRLTTGQRKLVRRYFDPYLVSLGYESTPVR